MEKFTKFCSDISSFEIPDKFTYPFYYTPNPLALCAAKELQSYIVNQSDWSHDFGMEDLSQTKGIGKMFGVLVVENKSGDLGYLSAFSGKLAGKNDHKKFVTPVFDMLSPTGFYKIGENNLNEITSEIDTLKSNPDLKTNFDAWQLIKEESRQEIETFREFMRQSKKERKQQRIELENNFTIDDREEKLKELAKESVGLKFKLKHITNSLTEKEQRAEKKYTDLKDPIDELISLRKTKSAQLQNKLFEQYQFLDGNSNLKSLKSIFADFNMVPPAAAGECAAPKLMHYAYLNNLKPIALAEFWWGKSPNSEIKSHKNYYPACRGKCEPILTHMLKGLNVDDNPLIVNPALNKTIDIVYEDDFMAVINKPAEFLSVPGKTIIDSVATRMKDRFKNADGPLIVHRLDMSTSGIMLIAKSKEVHKILQEQFINRTVKKRYIALLDGEINGNSGEISLPLRVDLDDRPRQLVCFEHGKNAKTLWEKIEVVNNKTKVYFYPVTGRTHQLRMHAAHKQGLNAPIVGDDLYGVKNERLLLHAESIELNHPKSKERITFQIHPEF